MYREQDLGKATSDKVEWLVERLIILELNTFLRNWNQILLFYLSEFKNIGKKNIKYIFNILFIYTRCYISKIHKVSTQIL